LNQFHWWRIPQNWPNSWTSLDHRIDAVKSVILPQRYGVQCTWEHYSSVHKTSLCFVHFLPLLATQVAKQCTAHFPLLYSMMCTSKSYTSRAPIVRCTLLHCTVPMPTTVSALVCFDESLLDIFLETLADCFESCTVHNTRLGWLYSDLALAHLHADKVLLEESTLHCTGTG
jgi:hypothetical protein